MFPVFKLLESKPENPDTVVVKNKYYTRGLTEDSIYDYYMSVKSSLLKEVKDRELMFFLMRKVNDPIVVRKIGGSFIELNSDNYEKMITGRTISIHSTMRRKEDFGIIDVDFHDFNKCKEATQDVYDYLISLRQFKAIQIKFTGKTSFHVLVYFRQSKNVDNIRELLKSTLQGSDLASKYLISSSRSHRKPNLDLSSNKFRGGFITLHSLSVLGLKSMIVSPYRLSSFKPKDVVIRG